MGRWLHGLFGMTMAVVTLTNIKKSFGKRDLLEDVSFFINERERAALIGANGTGKTTLLKIIYAMIRADAGTVNIEPGLKVGYLPQEVDLPEVAGLYLAVVGVTPEILACASELETLQKEMARATGEREHLLGSRYAEVSHRFDSLHGFDYQIKAKAILSGLGFDESEFDKPVRALSGGQKTRAALARLLLLEPDLLLLDEPTNHLDITACEWLQSFLCEKYNGAALIVSHDRYFLDQVVSKVVELDACTTITYKGAYSAFAQQKAARVEEQRKLYKEQKKEIERIEQAIQTLFSDRKFSRRDSKVKQLERIQRVAQVREAQLVKIKVNEAIRSGREVVRLSRLAKSYPGKHLFSGIDFVVERGRKIGVVGPNGSGKTTMLKIIAEREIADSGEVILGHNVKPVYFAQEFDHLVPTRSVLEELLADADLTAPQARDLLAKFLFMGDDSFKPVSVLSGGELCRLALAKVLAKSPNLLLLDEPTNHLDIASREALEDALRSFNGTVIACSHDRYLLDAISDEIVELKDGAFSHYLGNYSRYREKTWRQGAIPGAARPVEPPKQRRVSALREMERHIRELTRQSKQLEDEIHTIEARIAEITTALGAEENYRGGAIKDLTSEYDSLTVRLDGLYAEWETACEKLAEAEEALTDSR